VISILAAVWEAAGYPWSGCRVGCRLSAKLGQQLLAMSAPDGPSPAEPQAAAAQTGGEFLQQFRATISPFQQQSATVGAAFSLIKLGYDQLVKNSWEQPTMVLDNLNFHPARRWWNPLASRRETGCSVDHGALHAQPRKFG